MRSLLCGSLRAFFYPEMTLALACFLIKSAKICEFWNYSDFQYALRILQMNNLKTSNILRVKLIIKKVIEFLAELVVIYKLEIHLVTSCII